MAIGKEVYVLDANFDMCGVIDEYESRIWTRRARGIGDCEVYCRGTGELFDLLYGPGGPRYLVRAEDIQDARMQRQHFRNVMRLRAPGAGLEIKEDAETGTHFIITGVDCTSILRQRIIPRQVSLNDTLPNIVQTLLIGYAFPSSSTARHVEIYAGGHDIVTPSILTDTISRQWTGDNVYDAIYGMTSEQNLMITTEVINRQFRVSLYEGRDRSYDQSENNFVIFSLNYDNLLSTDYKTGIRENYATAAYVGGEGEGPSRKIVTAGGGTGLDRHEIWVDARNARSETEGGTLTDAQYTAQLRQEGLEAVNEAKEGSGDTFEGDVDFTISPFVLGTDYELNDIVQVSGQWVGMPRRVIEITESVDTNGTKTLVKFA